jgi:hypothetical protein
MVTMRIPMNGLCAFCIVFEAGFGIGLWCDNDGRLSLIMHVHISLSELLVETAGSIADQGKTKLGAAIDGRSVLVFGELSETTLFQDIHTGVLHMISGGEYLVDAGVIEQAADAGAEAREVHGVIGGDIKTIDADGSRLRKLVGEDVHLDSRMDLEQEERAVPEGDQIGAEDIFFIGFHAVIDLP